MSNYPQDLPLTIFGQIDSAEETPIFQSIFQYGILSKEVDVSQVSGGGSVSNILGKILCSTGTTSGAYARGISKDVVPYKAGQGSLARFTAYFETSAANSIQFAGAYSETDALGFGYNGTSFGILHRSQGKRELQELQVTTGAAGAETVTVTIDGVSDNAINITNSSVEENAKEIADALISNATITGWGFSQNEDKIICLSEDSGNKTGTFSFSSTGSAVASFSEITAGASYNDNWILEADWNGESLSESIDPSMGNVYKVVWPYLGFGNINLYVMDQITGIQKLVHSIRYANLNTETSFGNPSLKVAWLAESISSTTDLKVYGASMMGSVQGKRVLTNSPTGVSNTATSVATGTPQNILTIRNRIAFGGIANMAEIRTQAVKITTDASKGIIVSVYLNAGFTGVNNFQYIDETNSIAEKEVSAVTYTASTGTLVDSFPVLSESSEEINLQIRPGDTISIFANVISGASGDVSASIKFVEDL